MSATPPPLSPILQALERPLGRSVETPKSKSDRTADTFCAEGHMPNDALTVSVKDIGLLSSPLPTGCRAGAARSQHTGTPWQRDKTALDKRVRDTVRVACRHAGLALGRWARDALQAEVATALELSQVQARPHNLLVYGPGQFFKPHQDTEKHPGMVATLVLVWPSPHIGGELSCAMAASRRTSHRST